MANTKKKVAQGPGPAWVFAAEGYRLMRQGSFSEALERYRKYREAYSGPQLQQIGICLWCSGRHQEACEDWVFENERFEKHETTYLEYSLITIPSLLWWASTHHDVPDWERYRQIALKALKRRLKYKRTKYSGWALTCGNYLLGERDEKAMLDLIAGDMETLRWNEQESNRPDYAREEVEQKMKWELLETYFYVGAKALLNGDIARYREMLTHCSENVPRTPPSEFFLVAYELA